MKKPYETIEGVFSGVPLFTDARVPVFYLVDLIVNDATLECLFEDYEVDPECVETLLRSPLPLSLRHAKSPV